MFSAKELSMLRSSVLDTINSAPDEYFQLRTGVTPDEAWEAFKNIGETGLPDDTVPAVLLECLRLILIFVGEFEFQARTGYLYEDFQALLVSLELTGQPPNEYPSRDLQAH